MSLPPSPSVPGEPSKSNARGLSRRSVAKGAAWTAPALAVVVAAPVVAASVHPNAPVTSASGCKPKTEGDGSKDYYLRACFVNSDPHPVTISAPSQMLLNGSEVLSATGSPANLVLAPGATGCIVMHGVGTSAAQGSLQATFVVTDNGTSDSDTVTAFVPKSDVSPHCGGVTN